MDKNIEDILAQCVKDLTEELQLLQGELEEARRGRSFWKKVADLYREKYIQRCTSDDRGRESEKLKDQIRELSRNQVRTW